MIKTYNEPEFKAVKMTSEDVLTTSLLDQISGGWEAGSTQPGGTVQLDDLLSL